MAKNNQTNIGVKQHNAAITVPIIPVFKSLLSKRKPFPFQQRYSISAFGANWKFPLDTGVEQA